MALDCKSLRLLGISAYSTKVRPDTVRAFMAVGGENVIETVTPGVLATDEDTATEDPAIDSEKIAGNNPHELAAMTFPEASEIAASMMELGSALDGRLKDPNVNMSSVSAGISAPKTSSISEVENGLMRAEANMLAAFSMGAMTAVRGGEGKPDKS